MEKEEQKFVVKFFWMKGWGSKTVHQERMSTPGDDAYGLSQIKIWLQRFRTAGLSCGDLPRAGRPPLTLGPQVETFLQKYPFASARIIGNHFLAIASTVKGILQKELGMRKFSRRWVLHSLSDAQNVGPVEAAKEMSKMLQELEMNDFDGITTGDDSWFEHATAPSKMFSCSAAYVIPRTRQAVGAKQTLVKMFFIAKKFIVFGLLPRRYIFALSVIKKQKYYQ
jgi:transposase